MAVLGAEVVKSPVVATASSSNTSSGMWAVTANNH